MDPRELDDVLPTLPESTAQPKRTPFIRLHPTEPVVITFVSYSSLEARRAGEAAKAAGKRPTPAELAKIQLQVRGEVAAAKGVPVDALSTYDLLDSTSVRWSRDSVTWSQRLRKWLILDGVSADARALIDSRPQVRCSTIVLALPCTLTGEFLGEVAADQFAAGEHLLSALSLNLEARDVLQSRLAKIAAGKGVSVAGSMWGLLQSNDDKFGPPRAKYIGPSPLVSDLTLLESIATEANDMLTDYRAGAVLTDDELRAKLDPANADLANADGDW